MIVGRLFIVGCVLGVLACSSTMPQGHTRKPAPATQKGGVLSETQTKEVLGTAAEGWFYGQGLGETMMNVGTVALFPPYALFLLGNGILTVSGYEPLGVSTFLEGNTEKQWLDYYGSVASGPGRLTAAVAGEEFRTKERLLGDYRRIIGDAEASGEGGDGVGAQGARSEAYTEQKASFTQIMKRKLVAPLRDKAR